MYQRMLICIACFLGGFVWKYNHQKMEVIYNVKWKHKKIRKNKRVTQEELAVKVNVVRQTVSKWEKGLSVPDAEALQRIADALDVSVEELLGAEVNAKTNQNEIAEQLAKINEQLVIKNCRWSCFWRVIKIILVLLVLWTVLALFSFNFNTDTSTLQVEETELNVECDE